MLKLTSLYSQVKWKNKTQAWNPAKVKLIFSCMTMGNLASNGKMIVKSPWFPSFTAVIYFSGNLDSFRQHFAM